MDKITIIKTDLVQALSEISSYHPDKYSTQLMTTTAINKSRELFDVIASQQAKIERMKCCGNCNYSNDPEDSRSNGGCFGCMQKVEGKIVLHGWKPREEQENEK